ncbi:hypothetical protein BDW69DRAFT_183516 [Aspergillus filifer]
MPMPKITCTRNKTCTACKTLRAKIQARLDGKAGSDPILFESAHLYTNAQTYPVIFSVPEAYADKTPAVTVAGLVRELKPLGGTRIKVFRVANIDDALSCNIDLNGPRHPHAIVEFMVNLPEKMKINGEVKKDGTTPVILNPQSLTCLPGTDPVIFSAPEKHTNRDIGSVVSLVDRDLTPGARSLRVYRAARLIPGTGCGLPGSETAHYHNRISYMFDLLGALCAHFV